MSSRYPSAALVQSPLKEEPACEEAPDFAGLGELQNADRSRAQGIDPSLLDGVSHLVWRGHEFGRPPSTCLPTGFADLDAHLPGGGWPLSAVSELLQPQWCQAECRLLLPSLAPRAARKRPLLAIAPPHPPFFGGLRQQGLDDGGLVVIHASSPAERLWATEQAVKANGLAGVIAWLSHARGDQVRRLQTCAAQCGFPVFLVRPEAAQHESSAAPLRLQVRLQGLQTVAVHVLKRRGPAHVGWVTLQMPPPGLADLLALVNRSSPTAERRPSTPSTPPSPSPFAVPASIPPVLNHAFVDATVDGAAAVAALGP